MPQTRIGCIATWWRRWDAGRYDAVVEVTARLIRQRLTRSADPDVGRVSSFNDGDRRG